MSWFGLPDDDYFHGLFMGGLNPHESYLRIFNEKEVMIDVTKSLKECIECDYNYNWPILREETITVKSDANYRISRGDVVICDIPEITGQYGVFNLTVHDTDCTFVTEKEPCSIYTPILTVSLIYFLLYLGIIIVKKWLLKTKSTESRDIDESSNKKERIKSLDTFRGICIVTMIFVNMGAGQYAILQHVPWNGFHLADFVFPGFLWIMGACIPIALTSNFKKGISNVNIINSITKRSIKLFCIGIFLGSGIYLDRLRVTGVLQRFAICYFVVALICQITLRRILLLNTQNKEPRWTTSLEVTKFGWIPVIIAALSHLLIVFLVAEGDCERGYFGPGGLHEHGKYENCTGGATGYLDRTILGKHMYQSSTAYRIYKSLPFDPEGLVGSLNSIFHTFIGVQAGVILLVHKQHSARLTHWLSWSVLCLILGGCLCGFSKEDGRIPINKNLWSLSYVLFMSGCSFLLLAVCYIIIDMKKYWQGKPFFYAGMNSILMYIGHEVTANFFPFFWIPSADDRPNHFTYLLQSTTATAIWMYIAYYLYKIKFFFTL